MLRGPPALVFTLRTSPEYSIDNEVDAEHGHMTHALQDVAVDQATENV